MKITRRSAAFAPLSAAALLGLPRRAAALDAPKEFPQQKASRVYDTVLYAHSDLEKVTALVEASPALANATRDWGFGDWESALGAAAHMGRRDIAELLLEHGARPNVFAHAMLGHLDAVKAAIAAMPGLQRTLGPHGLTLLFHARAGGDAAASVVGYLEQLGGADEGHKSEPLLAPASVYLGEYRWGSGASDRFTISERKGQLYLGPPDDFPKSLFHVGNNEFHPGGAASVRVRFRLESGVAAEVSIFDAEEIVSAKRVAG